MKIVQYETIARMTASLAITALAILYGYYPGWHWVIPVIAVAGSLGIHLIPSVTQTKTVSGDGGHGG